MITIKPNKGCKYVATIPSSWEMAVNILCRMLEEADGVIREADMFTKLCKVNDELAHKISVARAAQDEEADFNNGKYKLHHID